jgi:RNA polymerase sigma-70 factor, ECF subfamily
MDDAPGNQAIESSPDWQRGDPAAFATLVRRWQQPLARFLAGMMGRIDLVEDLCQEVFLRVFLARSRYRETGAFASWLYRIARNVAKDALRRRRGQAKRLGNQEFKVTTPRAEARCTQQELADAILGALAELPWEVREVVVLRHYQEMNFKDIAELTGVPASTLRYRFELGMSRLRKHLEQRGWGP